MTSEEQMLWDYVEDESNELLLTMGKNVEADGYDRAPGPASVDDVVLKVLSAAIVKTLAVATERVGNYDLATAYMKMVPMHVELIKVYTFRALERSTK
jgi:hypothetical protein